MSPPGATEGQELSPDERAELERLRAETARLHDQGGQGDGPARRRRFSWRMPVSIVLIVLGHVVAGAALVALLTADPLPPQVVAR